MKNFNQTQGFKGSLMSMQNNITSNIKKNTSNLNLLYDSQIEPKANTDRRINESGENTPSMKNPSFSRNPMKAS